MRFVNYAGRLVLLHPDDGGALDGARGLDVERASHGLLPAAPEAAFDRWDEIVDWARGVDASGPYDLILHEPFLASPSPRPRQIFGVGLNYSDHSAETGMAAPELPLIFTKLGTSVTGPGGPIPISTDAVDWEVEVAVVIGRPARHATVDTAWEHVAGLTVAQDISERGIQMRPADTPQFGLGKSLPAFTPLGPALVTADALDDREDLALGCSLNGEERQSSRTSYLIFDVPHLIAYLSGITRLLPGDVILTGTPSGVGLAHDPQRFLRPGDELESWVEGIGSMRHSFVAEEQPREGGS
jgi:2,4-didehydro-3-deoxy-L-rhamnonate hydrolase